MPKGKYKTRRDYYESLKKVFEFACSQCYSIVADARRFKKIAES